MSEPNYVSTRPRKWKSAMSGLALNLRGAYSTLVVEYMITKTPISADPLLLAHLWGFRDTRPVGGVLEKLEASGLIDVANDEIALVDPAVHFGRAPIGPHLRMAVIEKHGDACFYCGADDVEIEIDHYVPLARGGAHDRTNLVPACSACNRSKGSKTVDEWRAVQ